MSGATGRGPDRYVVYALVDPRDGLPHYVGQTVDLSRRVAQHRSRKGSGRGLSIWMDSLQAAGVALEAEVLEEVDGREASKTAEARWIHEGARQGWPLANRHHSPLGPVQPPLPPGKTFAIVGGRFVGCLDCTLIAGKGACAKHRPSLSREAAR